MLHRLWPALEEIPGLQAVSAEWEIHIGEGSDALKSLFIPTDRFAESIPIADDPYSSYRVVRHAPDDIVGIHDGGGPVITLSKRDVLIYRLDHQRLIHQVTTALGIELAAANIDGVPHAYRVGSLRPFAGFIFPVFLALPLESEDLQRAVEVISAQCNGPFLLLAPTRRRLRPATELLLKNRNACFLVLDEAIRVDVGGDWVATAGATQALGDFLRLAIPQAAETGVMAFFPTPVDARWSDVRIKFTDGHTVSVKVGEAIGTFAYSQMGMADGRNAKPTVQWQLLRSFADNFGAMTWENSGAKRENQKRRDNLVRDLKAFFRIDGDPIEYIEQIKGWRTVFTIEPDA